MTPEQFAKCVYQETVVDGLISYHETYESNEKIIDPFYKRAIALYKSLSDSEKAVLFEIIRQAAVDTTAEILAILDGQRHDGKFILSYTPENAKKAVILNDGLTDIFLEIEEVGLENFDNDR
jgi:hypothetical protein